MVTADEATTRAEIAESMANMIRTTAALRRRGHEGKHKSCVDCGRYAVIHDNLSVLLTSYEQASE